ncbi:MAG: Electron transport complex subunit RsxB [Syntrophomonadaceae bacterium]|nr:Electron transport complex subunit RsxB [Bacillota bacterium]
MDIYESLREIMDAHPSTAPKARSIDEILKILFTPQEAAVAVNMSYKTKNPAVIAKKAGLSESEMLKHLEAMTNKGIIISRNKNGEKHYCLAPLIPGVFEFPFMKGGGTPMHKRLGELWEEYHREAFGASLAGNPTPLMRVVAVEKSITPRDRVHSYEEVKNLINDASYLALTKCACRVSVAGCDKPREVCLVFGNVAEFLVEQGFACQISRDEGLKVLNLADEAGLVHTSNNSADRANMICNCCSCCCTVLRGKTQLKHPHAFEPSRFEAQVRAGECTGCSICADERCPVKAINMENNTAVINAAECIGCGLCVTGCPAGAVFFTERKQVPSTPATVMEMGLKVLQEKGRLESFQKIMQS